MSNPTAEFRGADVPKIVFVFGAPTSSPMAPKQDIAVLEPFPGLVLDPNYEHMRLKLADPTDHTEGTDCKVHNFGSQF
jgi:hypothetical protein